MAASGTLYVIAAPSGAGKTTLVNTLLKEDSNLKISVSYTTRQRTALEEDGKDYFFVTELAFQDMLDNRMFLEHANVFGHWYGTGKKWVEEQLELGFDVILEIDWQGAQIVRKQIESCVSLMILPPSKEELVERIRERSRDSEEVISTRLTKMSEEVSHYNEFDYIVVNDDFNEAIDDIQAIIRAKRKTLTYQEEELSEVLDDLLE